MKKVTYRSYVKIRHIKEFNAVCLIKIICIYRKRNNTVVVYWYILHLFVEIRNYLSIYKVNS